MINQTYNVLIIILLSGIAAILLSATAVLASEEEPDPVLQYHPKAYQQAKKMSPSQREKYLEQKRDFNAAIEGCTVYFRPIEDNRQNKETVGVRGGNSLKVDEFEPWLESVYAEELKKAPYKAESKGADVVLEPSLTRLYSYESGGGFEAVSALNVEVVKKGKVSDRRHYRGFAVKIPVLGAERTQLNSLSQAMWQSLKSLELDLDLLCERYSNK